jgi:hypothetical protein
MRATGSSKIMGTKSEITKSELNDVEIAKLVQRKLHARLMANRMSHTEALSLVKIIGHIWPMLRLSDEDRIFWNDRIYDTAASYANAHPAVMAFIYSTSHEPPTLADIITTIRDAQSAADALDETAERLYQWKRAWEALPENAGLTPEQLEEKRAYNQRKIGKLVDSLTVRKFGGGK